MFNLKYNHKNKSSKLTNKILNKKITKEKHTFAFHLLFVKIIYRVYSFILVRCILFALIILLQILFILLVYFNGEIFYK